MNQLSVMTWLGSLVLHALVALPLFVSIQVGSPNRVYDEGAGNDAFKLEQGITIDVVSFGDAAERIEIAEVAPMIANPTPPPPVEEVKPLEPELKDVITATDSKTETVAAKEEPPPVEVVKPQEVAVVDQAAQVEMYAEKSAGQAQDGGKATALTAYVGKIHGALQRVKVPVANGAVGQVTLGFTLSPQGKVLASDIIQSSGVPSIDKAALAWLERAVFPPLPDVLGSGQRFNVPLTFKRKTG
jgi:periplasmic protein TonB